MKDLLIVFIVMLLLLIVISTLGGSIYPKEPFMEEKELEPFWEEQMKYEEKFSDVPPPPPTGLPSDVPAQLPTPPPSQVVSENPVKLDDDVVEGFDGDQWATVM
jgi:hypothetical protein